MRELYSTTKLKAELLLIFIFYCGSQMSALHAQSNEPSVLVIYRAHSSKLDKHYLYLHVHYDEVDSLPAGCRLHYTIHDEGTIHVVGRIKSYPNWPGDKIEVTSVPHDTTYLKADLGRDALGNIKLTFSAVSCSDAQGDMASLGGSCIITKSDLDDEEATDDVNKSGTGFLVSNTGLLITNYHLVDKARKITVKNSDWSSEATLIAQDKDNDLVLLKLSDSTAVKAVALPFSIRNVQAELGEKVSVFGYPLTTSMGQDVKLTTGIVSSVNGYEGNANSYQLTAPVQPGNSGGPVFDEKANLIGVINAKHLLAENATYAIKSTYLLNFLQSVPEYVAASDSSILQNLQLVEQAKTLQKLVYLIEIR